MKSLKPDKSIWGFLGIVLFFILPEIIAFFWGEQITAFAHEAMVHASSSAALLCWCGYFFITPPAKYPNL